MLVQNKLSFPALSVNNLEENLLAVSRNPWPAVKKGADSKKRAAEAAPCHHSPL
jgi:hypothetical protein